MMNRHVIVKIGAMMTIVIDPETIPVPVDDEPEPYDPDEHEYPDEQEYPKHDWGV